MKEFIGIWNPRKTSAKEIHRQAVERMNHSKKKSFLGLKSGYVHALGFIAFFVLVVSASLFAMGINPFFSGYIKSNNTSDLLSYTSIKNTRVITSEPTKAVTPIPEKVYTQPTQDPDPIVNCTVDEIGVVQMKQSVCSKSFACEVGEEWKLYQDRSKCTEDQNSYWSSRNQNTESTTNTNYEIPTYYSCTVCYQFSTGTECKTYDTLYETKAQCESAQQEINSIASHNQVTTVDVPQSPDNRYQNCSDQAVQSYNAAQQRANSYGSSSAGDAIRQIAKSDYNRAMQNCNQYPH